MIDYQALLDKLNPKPDGEGVTKLRTGVVSAVNANGTLDVAISGVVIPSLPRVLGVTAQVGDVVSVITYLGAMLVLGVVGALPAGRDGAIHGLTATTSSGTVTVETVLITGAPSPTTFKAGRVYEITTFGITQGASPIHTYRVRKTNVAGQQLLESRIQVDGNTPINDNGIFKVSGTDVSATLVVTGVPSTAVNMAWIAGVTFPRGFYVQDIGSENNPSYAGVPALT